MCVGSFTFIYKQAVICYNARMKFVSKSLAETKAIAHKLLNDTNPKEHGATVVGLHGDLGSGKTAFTQAVAEILGVKEIVTSPTFVIEKIYPLNTVDLKRISSLTGRFDRLIHIDAYRLDSGKELADLGWKEIAENPKNLILIEWPEKVTSILPDDIKKVSFRFIDESTREVIVND
jgi:tRNA threonylcarbamoyladenosine biosynthesis protein TsaE